MFKSFLVGCFLLLISGSAMATPVQFDFSGNLGVGSQNGNTSFGTTAAGTAFWGTIIYDTETPGIAVGNNPGVPLTNPNPNWDKKQYAFESFSLTIGTETFSMTGHNPTNLNAEPYGTIFITDFPNTDQFYVEVAGNRFGFGDLGPLFGGKNLWSIGIAFSGKDLLNDVGTDLMTADVLQDRFDASSRAVMTLMGKDDYYTVSSTINGNASSPVPEPATMLLFGFGLLSLAGISRKK